MGRWAYATLQQSLHGFRDIAVLGRRAYFTEQYDRVRGEIGRTRYLRQLLGDVPRIALETSLMLFVAVLVAGSALAGASLERSFAVLGMFAYAALRILPSLSRLLLQMNDLKFGSAAAAAVHRDLLAIESGSAPMPDRDPEPLPFDRTIRLENVSYRYPQSDHDALEAMNLEIARGEFVGIVGPTGGGKSTLVDVILGLLKPTQGRVLIDDTDIHAADLDRWQRSLGVVSQTVYLLDTTLRRNVALGLEDDAIDEERVREAVRLAQLESFIESLPAGLDTVAGERGVRLSGGQRQRLAVARALYHRPQVLVLDEGTSALDNATEADLLRALSALRRSRTLIIVAHRLTTVRDCDRVLFVDNGRIVDAGTLHDLMERNPAFRRLAGAALSPATVLSEAPPTTCT
jgi:ATP-binding cassette subfamily C protein